MTETPARTATRRRASTNYRHKKAHSGESQVVVWLPVATRERLDKAVKDGGYKNRSEAVNDALLLSLMLEGAKM